MFRRDSHFCSRAKISQKNVYTNDQPQKLLRQFAYPSATKLCNLLKKACLEAVTAVMLERINQITSRFKPFQRIRNDPVRFGVSIGHENTWLNARAYDDVIHLDWHPVPHIVNEAARFSSARCSTKRFIEPLWEALVWCWSSIYTRFPQYVMVEECSRFRKIFAELASFGDSSLEKGGAESHSSLGMGEIYQNYQCETYRKL